MDMNNYLAQRLAAIGVDGGIQKRLEALEAENTRLKEQLGQAPAGDFKSEAQIAFEQSPEFEQILNVYYMRFLRERFGAEFRASPYLNGFQGAANAVFAEFEKDFKKKEATPDAQTGKKNTGTSKADAGKDA